MILVFCGRLSVYFIVFTTVAQVTTTATSQPQTKSITTGRRESTNQSSSTTMSAESVSTSVGTPPPSSSTSTENGTDTIWNMMNIIAVSAAGASNIFLVIVIIAVCRKKTPDSPQSETGGTQRGKVKTNANRKSVSSEYIILDEISESDRSMKQSEQKKGQNSKSGESFTRSMVPGQVLTVGDELSEKSTGRKNRSRDPYCLAGPLNDSRDMSDRDQRSNVCKIDGKHLHCSTGDDDELIMVENDLYESL